MSFDFNFNPSLWFLCKLCREVFPDTDKLKAHKLKNHLAESLKIKCIVFEEKLLDHEWIPSPSEFVSKQDQLLNLAGALPQETNKVLTETDINPLTELKSQNQKQIRFKNPFVSLKRLTNSHIVNSENSVSAVKIDTAGAGTQSKVVHDCSLELKDTNGKIFSKQNHDFASEPIPCSYPQLIQRKTDNYDDDNVHNDKIRELLSNAVIIKTEPNHDGDDELFLEPQVMPISILSSYSLPALPPSSLNSKIINPVKGNASSNNSLQQPPHQLPLRRNTAGVSPKTSASPNNNIPKTLLKSEIVPTFTMQPQEKHSYPVTLNVNGQLIQAQDKSSGNSTSFYQNETKNLSRLNAKFSVSTETAEPHATSLLKVEIIDYENLTAQNPSKEMISIETEAKTKEPQKISRVHSQSCRDQSNKIQKSFVCPICRAPYGSKSSLTRHGLTHSVNRQYQCRYCDSVLKTQSDLRVHLVARHGGTSSFRCQFCGKSLPSKDGLIAHEAVHTGARPYKCDFPNCRAELTSRTALNVHKRTVHREELGQEEFACHICGKIYGLRCFVTRHVKRVHPDQVMQILS